MHPSLLLFFLTTSYSSLKAQAAGERENISFFPSSTRGPFLESPEIFRARKAIFSLSLSENGQVYTLENSRVNGTSLRVKNIGPFPELWRNGSQVPSAGAFSNPLGHSRKYVD